MYERYRRQHLEDRLENLATTMEETLLQQTIAETFFETTTEIDEEIKSTVERTTEKLENGEYDAVEQELDDVAERVERAETHVTNEIQQLRINRQDIATAMRRLNERVERVDAAQLQALESLLEDWKWKQDIYDDTNETFKQRRDAAVQFGENMKFVFQTLKQDLFGPYEDTKLEPLVDKLLDDDRLRLGALSLEERRQLADSDLADYIELKLS
jgi:hypothetical protein